MPVKLVTDPNAWLSVKVTLFPLTVPVNACDWLETCSVPPEPSSNACCSLPVSWPPERVHPTRIAAFDAVPTNDPEVLVLPPPLETLLAPAEPPAR